MKKVILGIILFLVVSYSQNNINQYLPLEIGNYWILQNESHFYPHNLIKIMVSDSININNYKYFILNNDSGSGVIASPSNKYSSDTIRISESGNLHKLLDGKDYLWFDFSIPSGARDTIKFEAPYQNWSYNILYDYNSSVDSYVMNYTSVLLISSKLDRYFTTFSRIYLVKNIGFVAKNEMSITTEGYDHSLYEAKVGNILITDIQELSELPIEYKLCQNYPNPFNPKTNIEFMIRNNGFVELLILNSIGELISKPVCQNLIAGTYKIKFNGGNLPSGIYYYQLKTNKEIITKKMVLIK